MGQEQIELLLSHYFFPVAFIEITFEITFIEITVSAENIFCL